MTVGGNFAFFIEVIKLLKINLITFLAKSLHVSNYTGKKFKHFLCKPLLNISLGFRMLSLSVSIKYVHC